LPAAPSSAVFQVIGSTLDFLNDSSAAPECLDSPTHTPDIAKTNVLKLDP